MTFRGSQLIGRMNLDLRELGLFAAFAIPTLLAVAGATCQQVLRDDATDRFCSAFCDDQAWLDSVV